MSTHRDGRTVKPFDPDVELITGYLTETLGAAERREVERRFMEDTEFQIKAMPLVALWHEYDDVPGETIEETFDAFESAAAAAPPSQRTRPSATLPAISRRPATQRWRDRLATWTSAAGRHANAASLLPIAALLIGGVIASALATVAYDEAHRPHAGGGQPPSTIRGADPVFLEQMLGGTRFAVAADSPARRLDLPSGLEAVLQPGSVFSYRHGFERTYRGFLGGARGGELSIAVRAPVRQLTLFTVTGRITLKPGRYVIRVAGGDTLETDIRTFEGRADAYAVNTFIPRLVYPGERALMVPGERARMVPP